MKFHNAAQTNLRYFFNLLGTLAILASLGLGIQPTQAIIVGPYTPDTNTLHLWHLDEAAAPALDSVVTGGINLTGLLNTATLSNPSAPGFGGSLSTFNGGAGNIATRNAGLFPSTVYNTPTVMTYADPSSGAFTMEALVCPQFNPMDNLGTTNVGGNGRNNQFQIISGESSANGSRVWQFRLSPIGTYTVAPYATTNPNTAPFLEFINVNLGAAQNIPVPIPTNGPNAIASNQWYHVAVTFNGHTNTAGNINFYWTLISPETTCANLIGSTNMTNALPAGVNIKPAFAIANQGRSDNGNWVGLMDEVRMSGVARSPVEMIFTPSKDPTKITPNVLNNGNTLQLTWPADHRGWTLQCQTNSTHAGLTTNWSAVAGSTVTNQLSIPIGVSNGSVFYQLVFP